MKIVKLKNGKWNQKVSAPYPRSHGSMQKGVAIWAIVIQILWLICIYIYLSNINNAFIYLIIYINSHGGQT